MFDAARLMSGEPIRTSTKCIVGYEVKQKKHIFTTKEFDTGELHQLVLSNLLFDNGFKVDDIADTKVKQRDNGCWAIEFAIHSKNDMTKILTWSRALFIDSRLWVAHNKIIKSTRWKHPYTEMPNGSFNARPGLCTNTMDIVRQLISIGCDIEQSGSYSISKINKHGFMQIETDSGLVTQHLNNFDEVDPEEILGVWHNDNLNLWVFEDTDEVNSIKESNVYLLLDTHSRQPRFCAKNMTGPVYTYDYTKAKAFFSDTEAMNFAKSINRRMHTTFTVDEWI